MTDRETDLPPPSVTVLTLTVSFMGQTSSFTYAAEIGDRDPMDMTLGEWKRNPALSAHAMLAKVLGEHRQC